MEEDLSYSRRWIYKYRDWPELFNALVKHYKAMETYMTDDSVPPLMKDYPKSRLDVIDLDLTLKCRQHDFIQACASGDLDEAKRIVKLYKKPFQAEILNCTDENGWSGLDHAYFLLQPEVVKYLLKHKAQETAHTLQFKQDYNANLKQLAEMQAGPSRCES